MLIRKLFSIIGYLILFSSCNNKSSNNSKLGYWENGNLKFIKRYKDNLLEGQSQWFYPDGTIEQFVLFKQGKENGNAYYYYPSGALKSFRHWRDGLMNGYVADYFDDTVGIIKAVLIYANNGRLIYKKNFDSLGRFLSEEGRKPTLQTDNDTK